MSPEYWKKIKDIFEAALEKDPEEINQFLNTACSTDDKLRIEVEALLAAHKSTGDFLENPSFNINKNEIDIPDQYIGREFRSYKIEKKIASGGMASVYLASRADEQFHKKVAVKFIKRGMDTDEIIKRFKTERNALANLDHQYIASVFDGGTTEDGLPYFIMEYIEGKPIDVYCKEKKLSLKEKLILFQKVCAAVHFAHQNLIVHRDIKPNNILVTEDGLPKLLDFGIAKILSTHEDEGTVLTRVGMRIMTLEYASPEQIKGARITTASDVYSLGVLLYELLTGKRPYNIKDKLPHAAEKIITESEPLKPSSAVYTTGRASENAEAEEDTLTKEEAKKLRKALSGDLDNIVMMALKKDRERRYSTVKGISNDISNYLNELPVNAHADSIHYRFSKFVKRNKAGVAASIIIFILMMGAIVAVSWQANVAAVERDKAQLESQKSAQINTFLNDMLSSVDPEKSGKDVTVSEVLDEASIKLNTDLKQHPEIEADIRTTIGITYQNLGLYEEGKVHLKRALEIRDSLFGPNDYQTAYSIKNLALLYHYQWDTENAVKYYERSISLLRKNSPYPNKALAEALNDYGSLLTELYEFERAEKIQRESLEMYKDLFGYRSKDVAAGLNNLGLTLHNIGQLDSAERFYKESANLNKSIHGEESIPVSYNLNNLAFVANEKGDGAAAESLFYAAYQIRKKTLGPEHPTTINTKYNHSAQLFHLDRLEEAELGIKECIVIWKKKVSDDHAYLGNAYGYLGKIQNKMNKLNEAEENLKRSISIRLAVYPEENELVVKTKNDLADTYILKGKFENAEDILLKNFSLVKENEALNKSTIDLLIKLYKFWGKPAQENKFAALL